jgi:hypothetical protein
MSRADYPCIAVNSHYHLRRQSRRDGVVYSGLFFLEWLGRLSPFGNTDWTLIVAWKKSWEERNYLKGVLLTVAMGWWWFIVGVALVLLCLTPLILASSASLGYAGRGLFGRSRCILCGSYPAERVARVCRLCDDGRCFNCGDPFPHLCT